MPWIKNVKKTFLHLCFCVNIEISGLSRFIRSLVATVGCPDLLSEFTHLSYVHLQTTMTDYLPRIKKRVLLSYGKRLKSLWKYNVRHFSVPSARPPLSARPYGNRLGRLPLPPALVLAPSIFRRWPAAHPEKIWRRILWIIFWRVESPTDNKPLYDWSESRSVSGEF